MSSATMPPVNSRPQLKPRTTMAPIETTIRIAERIMAARRRPMKSMVGLSLSSCTGNPAADRKVPKLCATAVDEIDHHTRHDDAREHGGQDAERERDGEALDRAGAEGEQ